MALTLHGHHIMGYAHHSLIEDTEKALLIVKNILSANRSPRVATTAEPHSYDDKYSLSEFLCNVTLGALFGALETIGLDESKLHEMHNMAVRDGKEVTLRFVSKSSCDFVQEREVKKEVSNQSVDVDVVKKDMTTASPGTNFFVTKKNQQATIQSKLFTTVKEFDWNFTVSYKIYAYYGCDDNLDSGKCVMLKNNTSTCCLINTGVKEAPINVIPLSIQRDVHLTWLFRHYDPENALVKFSIDRTLESCKTPRRNIQVLDFFHGVNDLSFWLMSLLHHLEHCEQLSVNSSGDNDSSAKSLLRLSSLDDKDIFNPILPLFTSRGESNASTTATTPVSFDDIHSLIKYHKKSLKEVFQVLSVHFPAVTDRLSEMPESLITLEDARIFLASKHACTLITRWNECVDYVEKILENQLINAVGKVISPTDLQEFFRFHNRTFFSDPYIPEPFSYAIRRPDHYPDGMLSIEKLNADVSSSVPEPIDTWTRCCRGELFQTPLKIPINAATSITCTGDRYLHGWVRQTFHNVDEAKYQLAARARQFSGFVLLVGKLAGPNLFEPEHAMVLQNKDEILIPLILDQLPSAKEFKDAISSLSPEQQRFCQMFRKKQLSSSVFGVCVIQLKPQLELLLGLPEDSLTKEIRLTQDLLQLFIDYQIPSDLLSYDGPATASVMDKVVAVKSYVKAVLDVIDQAKRDSLNSAQQTAKMTLYDNFAAACPPPSHVFNALQDMQAMTVACASVPMMGTPAKRSMRMLHSVPAPIQHFAEMSSEGTLYAEENGAVMDDSVATDTIEKRIDEVNIHDRIQGNNIDFTLIPHLLDNRLENDPTVKTTIIKAGEHWTKNYQRNILTKMEERILDNKDKTTERSKTFDLLDAISRSGTLPIACAEFHVVIAATQSYEKSVIATIIEDNINPIERMEMTSMIVAAAVHGRTSMENLLRNDQDYKRLVENASIRSTVLQFNEDNI